MICRLLMCFETVSSELVGIRTPNLLIRSEVLYPVELQVQYLNWTAKIGVVINLSKLAMRNSIIFWQKISFSLIIRLFIL